MFEQANCTDDLAFLDHANLTTFELRTGSEIAGIADDLLGFDCLVSTTHTNKLAVRVCDDFMDGLIQHVGPAINGTETSEGLGKLSQAVKRVDVGRFAIAGHRGGVEDDAVICGPGRLGDVTNSSQQLDNGAEMGNNTANALIVKVKCHGMTNEVLSTRLETELLIHSLHRVLVEVNACNNERPEHDQLLLGNACTP